MRCAARPAEKSIMSWKCLRKYRSRRWRLGGTALERDAGGAFLQERRGQGRRYRTPNGIFSSVNYRAIFIPSLQIIRVKFSLRDKSRGVLIYV